MSSRQSHSQFELFPDSQSEIPQGDKQKGVLNKISVKRDYLLFGSIALVLFFVVTFSWGVERGKRRALNSKIDEGSPQTDQNSPIEVVTSGPKTVVQKVESQELGAGVSQNPAKEEIVKIPEIKEQFDNLEEKLYTIQVASFKTEVSAKKEAELLREKGHESFVVPKGSYNIVCVGKFDQFGEAKKFSDKLKKTYQDLLVRRM